MDSTKKLRLLAEIGQVFTPSAPINDADLFAGRLDQIAQLVGVIGNPGQHAILFGERGIGKTSVANVAGISQAGRRPVVRVNCTSDYTYQSLWHGILRKLGHLEVQEHEITYNLILELIGEAEKRPFIIIDELDRFESDDGMKQLADTIKAFSDHALPITIALVGVGDTITELIGDHRSVERCLVQIPMPRMSRRELGDAINRGLGRLQMSITDSARTRITSLSEGLPPMTHLLAHQAATKAVQNDDMEIGDEHVNLAIKAAVKTSIHSLAQRYETAVRSRRPDNLFKQVILACALAKKNTHGWFQPRDVRAPVSRLLGRDVKIRAFNSHLADFTTSAHDEVLEKGERSARPIYRFENPMMQAYVIVRGIADGWITDEVLREYRPPETGLFD